MVQLFFLIPASTQMWCWFPFKLAEDGGDVELLKPSAAKIHQDGQRDQENERKSRDKKSSFLSRLHFFVNAFNLHYSVRPEIPQWQMELVNVSKRQEGEKHSAKCAWSAHDEAHCVLKLLLTHAACRQSELYFRTLFNWLIIFMMKRIKRLNSNFSCFYFVKWNLIFLSFILIKNFKI